MTDKEKYDFIDHVVHLALLEEDRLLNEHGGDYSGLEEDGIDSNEYYRIITKRVMNTLKKDNKYMQEEPVSEDLKECKSKIILEGTNFNKSWYAHPELAFISGAKWQKEQLPKWKRFANVTCWSGEIEVKIDAGGYPYIPAIELYDYDNNVSLAKEGGKYKVVLIKE